MIVLTSLDVIETQYLVLHEVAILPVDEVDLLEQLGLVESELPHP